MKVNVTQHHINKGIRGQSSMCPVAYAIKELFPSAEEIVIGLNWGFVLIEGYLLKKFYLPKKVRNHIFDFDTGLGMSPFCFELKLYEPKDNELSNRDRM